MRNWIGALSAILLLTCGPAHAGAPVQVDLSWDQLQSRVANHKVAFVLPDGTRVEGKALGVEPEGLRMKVTRTSNRSVQPKGTRVVPRQGLSVLRVTEYGKMGRLLVTLGAVGAAAGIVAASDIDVYEGPLVIIVPVVIAGGIAGAGIGGYFAGKAIDKRVTEIRIVPGPPSAAESTAR